MEEAAEKKAKAELFEHTRRVELLTETCETFKTAKARLVHENNKLRDAEIWERYITTDRMPYPENVPNMHDHLYLWKNDKSSEYMEFALGKCDSYVDTLKILDELIEYPLYSSKETVKNWKDLRREWREEFLYKLDKASFNLIKNLEKNFKQDSSESHIYSFDMEEEHVDISICAYIEDKSESVLAQPHIKLCPKISFPVLNAQIVMPAAYRTNPFILRLIHLDQDFFSESSLTYYCPESIPMESDLLSEIHRCFEAKKEAKSLVADREREKVRQAKLKVIEIQTAASQAEKSFNTFQQQTVDTSKVKKRESKISLLDKPLEKKEPKKKVRTDVVIVEQSSNASIFGPGGLKRPRGVMDEEGDSMAKSLFQSAGTKRALDSISMKSGMRKKQDRLKKVEQSATIIAPEPHNIFYTHSMISLTHRLAKVEVHRTSELCFESEGSQSKLDISLSNADDESFDSLDLMLGTGDEEESDLVRPLRQLIRDVVIFDRDSSKRSTKSVASISYDNKRGKRTRGKSSATLKLKGLGDEADAEAEAPQTASEVFESNEEIRQEQYMSSLLFQAIPHKRIQLNLREYSVIGGTYILDLIFHESQPHKLRNGNTVQIFYGEMNIKRDAYMYDYKPPGPKPDDDPELVKDPELQHLLHVKLSLPTEMVFLEAPFVALWDRELKFWTKEHVHKVNIDLESHSASFSIDRVWPFAFFMKKYHLLPFVSWSMKPKLDTGGVTLALQCVRASFEFYIVGFQVCLSKAVTSDGGVILPLSDIVGEFMQLHRLINTMKSKGLNIFPDEDAFLYVQSNSKDVVLEDHTYLSMAMFADSLEFLSCNFNMDPKRQKLAFQVRECLAYDLELRYRTVIATSLSAQMYRVGLEDVSIDDTKLENLGFCPDVCCLLKKSFTHVSPSSPPNPLQILAIYTLLSRTKVLSYCATMKKDVSANSSTASKRSIRKKKKGKKKAAKSLMNRLSGQSLSFLSTASVI